MDLALTWKNGNADLVLQEEDLGLDRGLAPAIMVSLFSDRRRPEDERASSEMRGWWPDTEEDRHGSLLWLLQREKITNETLTKVRSWVEDALQWMLEDSIAESISVHVERDGVERVQVGVQLTRGSAQRWQHLWDGMEATLFEHGSVAVSVSFT